MDEVRCKSCKRTQDSDSVNQCINCNKPLNAEIESTGGKTDFYNIENCGDVDDLCNHWDLTFFEGNCLKAIVGIAKGKKGLTRHSGTSVDRDSKKLLHYAELVSKHV